MKDYRNYVENDEDMDYEKNHQKIKSKPNFKKEKSLNAKTDSYKKRRKK